MWVGGWRDRRGLDAVLAGVVYALHAAWFCGGCPVFYGKKMGGKNMKPSGGDAAFLALMTQRPDVPMAEFPRHWSYTGEVRFLSACAQGFELNEADE